jgi:hypothetical protein
VEPTQTRKSIVIIIVAALLALVLAPALFWLYRTLQATPLSELIRSDLPVLDLQLQFVTIEGKAIPGDETRLGKGMRVAKRQPSAAPAGDCPELIGGDTRERTQGEDGNRRGENCPGTARWVVKRHPIGFSLTFQDGGKVLSLFDDNTPVNALFRSRFVQGIFYEPLQNAGIRAEDLRLEGLEGAFLRTFIAEALSAHGELHYDIAHGKKGFVFSFVRNECAYVSKALPVMARVLGRSGYRVSSLKEPILEMRIGLQRLFMTEHEGRTYLANGLEALINVLESLPAPAKPPLKTPLVLTVRSEAFVSKILPVMTGEPVWEMRLGFGLSEENPGTLEFAAGKLTRALCPKVYRGVPAGIPNDVFAALVTSYALFPDMKAGNWRRLAADGPGGIGTEDPAEAGFAIIWDLDAQVDGLTQVGVIIANPKTPEAAEKFKGYFRDPALTAECGGGTVFLAATSEKLLVRMKESCGGQSLSVLDWERGGRAKAFDTAQFFLFLNPGSGMRELFLAGGAAGGGEGGEFAPRWKQEYEAAKAAMRRDGEKIFGALPIFAYSGNGSPTAKRVELKGFTVKQGGQR